MSVRTWVIRWVAAVFYAACALVLAEGALVLYCVYKAREASTHQQDVIFMSTVRDGSGGSLWRVMWSEYEPGASKEIRLANGQHYAIRISKDGFRTRDIPPKAAGVFRILAIGASTTVQGETNETTYPAYLERLLAEARPGTPVEVYNLGVSGTRSDYWLGRFDRLLALQPDLVIQYNAINDLAHAGHYAAYYRQRPWLAFLRGRFLYQALWPARPQEFTGVYEHILSNMVALHDRLQAYGIRYATATFASPDPDALSGDFAWFLNYNVATHWGRASKTLRYRDFHAMLAYYNRYMAQRLHQAGIPVVPLDEHIRAESDFIDACHMTDAGIRKQAAAFAELVAPLVP